MADVFWLLKHESFTNFDDALTNLSPINDFRNIVTLNL